MEYRRLGRSGLQVSLAGLGCNNFGMRIDETQTQAVVNRALDEGITLFDTADIYGNRGQSEQWLGKALGTRRREIVLATKFGMAMGDGPYHIGASRRRAIACCEDSLRRLNTDYIDLYQVHAPDANTPEEETLEALDSLVKSGKVRYIGSSNYAGWQVADAAAIARERGLASYVTAQNAYNLLDRGVERELLPACRHFGVSILPFFPLASGFLTGKYRRGADLPKGTRLEVWQRMPMAKQLLSEGSFATLERLEEYASSHGHSMLELAVCWLAARPEIASVISGATQPEQVTANVKALTWKLGDAEMKEIDKLAPL